MPMATKFGRMLTCLDLLLPMKSHGKVVTYYDIRQPIKSYNPLNMWPCEVTK